MKSIDAGDWQEQEEREHFREMEVGLFILTMCIPFPFLSCYFLKKKSCAICMSSIIMVCMFLSKKRVYGVCIYVHLSGALIAKGLG